MAGYLIANIEITDPAGYEEYRRQVPAVIARYGGRFIVRGGAVDPREGDMAWKRVVVLEFPSLDAARRFYDSPEYRPLIALRASSTKSDVAIVAGVEG